MDAKDHIDCTALHYAANLGDDEITTLLLEANANPNATSVYKITPLHIATTPKVVQELLRHGSNLKAQMVESLHEECNASTNMLCVCTEFSESISKSKARRTKSTGESETTSITAFQNLMGRDIKISKIALDEFVSTNGKPLDSSALKVVYDLEVFQDLGSVKDSCEIITNNPSLLGHPVYDALITFQWSNIRSFVTIFGILMMTFVICMTRVVVLQTNKLQEYSLIKNATNLTNDHCSNMMSSDESFSFITECSPSNELFGFYICCWILLLTIVIREVLQLIAIGKDYVKSRENWMEWLMIISSITYMTLLLCNVNASVLQQSASFTVYFVWMDLMLFLGRISVVGVYIHMYFSVLHTLCFFLLLFCPILAAFALSFHALLLENPVFESVRYSFLKIIVMAIGEIEFEGNFFEKIELDNGIEGVQETGNLIAVRIIFAFFILLGCIALMNLLIGLAVNEIEQLKEQANLVRLQQNRSEIMFLEFYKDNNKMTKIYIKPNEVRKPKMNNWIWYFAEFFFQTVSNTSRNPSYPVYCLNTDIDSGFTFSQELVDETLNLLIKKDGVEGSYDE